MMIQRSKISLVMLLRDSVLSKKRVIHPCAVEEPDYVGVRDRVLSKCTVMVRVRE